MFKWINTGKNAQAGGVGSSTTGQAGPGPSSTAHAGLDSNGAGPSNAGDANEKRFGMENFGNTCYANSVLQALYGCQPFRDLLIASNDALSSMPAPSSAPAPSPSVKQRIPSKASHTREPSTTTPAEPASLHIALKALFSHIATHPKDKGVVAPQAFVAKLKKENALFRSSMHQDAHEFLNYLLNKVVEDLEEEGKGDPLAKSVSSVGTSTTASSGEAPPSAASLPSSPPPSSPPPLIQSLFQGTLTNETRCLTCERVTSRSEPFLDLSLDISQNNTSLNSCLRHFSKSEMLTARNKFFCDECCGLVEAEKRMKVKTLPPILLLHLKRFKYQEDLGKYIKLSYRVAFPLELRLYNNTVDPTTAEAVQEGRGRRRRHDALPYGRDDKETDSGESKGAGSGGPGDPEGLYKLFAVVVHIGGGPHHGHYITLVKTPSTWLLYDDDSVEPIKESDIPKYFGDSTFTVEAAVSAASTTVTTPVITSGTSLSVSGVISSAKTLAANQPTPQPKAAGVGSGYVLFYQAANIDYKALGLVTKAAQQATEMGKSMLAEAVDKAGSMIPPPPTTAQIIVDEPESPGHVPLTASSSSFTGTGSSSPSASAEPSPVVEPRQPRHGLSLDLPPSLAPTPMGPEDQLSPLALPPSIHANGNGGFFKGLKHSASVTVGKSANGFGLAMSGPAPHKENRPPIPNLSAAGSSTPVLATPSTLMPPPPPIPKEKDKSGWFSSARKSVKRKGRYSREKDSDRDQPNATTSFSSAAEESSPHRSVHESPTAKVVIPDSNGYGGWVAGNGSRSGFDDGTPGPASAGFLQPTKTFAHEDRRASDPNPPAPVPIPNGRPTSITNGDAHAAPFPLAHPESPTLIPVEKGKQPPSPNALPAGSSPPSPVKNGRHAMPRKSLTLDSKEDGGIMKRATRKMSLNSGGILGWTNKDKDRRG